MHKPQEASMRLVNKCLPLFCNMPTQLQVIYDLLVPNSNELQLREDPVLGAVPSGLTRLDCSSAQDILRLLEQGNSRRKTERTDANARSSRSHAVLEVQVKRTRRNHYKARQLLGKLSLVDLAGSERAADTNNIGQKLRDGANINRSLLALANCINALGKASAAGGRAYVPYRNSKLTRLLKDGLSGNSRTAMIATVAAASDQYNHSINTLKYADRAKEIRTHIVQNVGSVESHISDYRRIIDNLQV
jgi:kinesin family member 18/19